MSTAKQASQKSWTSNDTIELINLGSLQRIADALEKIAGNWNALVASRAHYQNSYESEQASNAALRGQITKLRNKLETK